MPVGPGHPSGSPPRVAYALAVVAAVTVSLLAGALAVGPSLSTGPRSSVGFVPLSSPAPSGPILPLFRPTWINVTNTTPHAAPPLAVGAASAYDPLMNATVYFGGCVQNGACPDNQTWLFVSGIWRNITDHTDAPPAREWAAMDYDPNMQAVLLFGGRGVNGPLNDTWTFQDGVWTNVTFYSPAPPARFAASLAFDPQPEENGSVLFGGCVQVFIFDACDNDTWVWQGDSGWVELNTSVSPPIRGWAMMAFDATDGYVVLFGGTNGILGLWDDTWELYAGQWWNVTPSGSPPATAQGGMVYVPSLSAVLMFGGLNASADYVAMTWAFTGGAWYLQAPSTSPTPRGGFDIALDATGTTPIVQGGQNATTDFRDTWAYEYAPGAVVGANVTGAEVGQSVEVGVTVGGGTPPYTASVGFGDGSGTVLSGAGPVLHVAHVYASTGVFNLTASVTDAVGAAVSAVPVEFSVSAGPRVEAKAAPPASDVGLPVDFDSTVLANGTLPLSYTWAFGDGDRSTDPDPTHAYAAAGTYRVTLNATDAVGVVASSTVTVVISKLPVLTVASAPASPGKGVETTFFANVSGGTGPYAFSWRFGDGGSSLLPTPQHWYNTSGTFRVSVWVNDSVGGSAHAVWNITVPSGSTFWGPLSGAPLWFWGGLGAIAAAGAGGTVLLRSRRPKL